jgi:putative membrane protein
MTRSDFMRSLTVALCAASVFSTGGGRLHAQTVPTPTVDPRRFLQDMVLAGVTEVEVANLAAMRGAPDVAAFARQVVRDQSEVNRMLIATAAGLGIQLHTQLDALQRGELERLGALQGAEFDREFLKLVVLSHEDHVRRLGTMATSGVSVQPTPKGLAKNEPDVALWAGHTLPITQQHLRIARELQAKHPEQP